MPQRTSYCCSNRKPDTNHDFTVSYDSDNHFQVLFQMWGSVWPRVLPYCMINVVTAGIIEHFVKDKHMLFGHYTGKGHALLSMIVSFLLVTRIMVSYGRYTQIRAKLEAIITKHQQLIQQIAVFSSDNLNESGKEFRHDMAFMAMTQLRSIMAVMDYDEDKLASWELPEIDTTIASKLREQLFLDERTKLFAHHAWVSKCEENMRVPVRLALYLRKMVMSQKKRLDAPFEGCEENKLLASIDGIMNGYYDIRGFIAAPFPFPLVQMSRTFLFIYLFTIPFAFVMDVNNPIGHYIVIFFLTYGFMGLEFVSIELDNPFGDDDNDFANMRLCCFSFEDTYCTILDIDGEEWTDKLRKRFDGGKCSIDLPPEATEWLKNKVEV